MRKETVKLVYKHLFASVAEVMKKGEYQNILLSGFGKFIVKPGRREKLDKLYRRNGTKNNNSSEQSQNDSSPTILEERDSGN